MKRLDEYSQHFLRSPRLVEDLLRHTSINSSDTVYDIGAGSGVITSVLAKRVKHVVAIEYEPSTARTLRQNVEAYTNVTIRQADIMQFDLPRSPYKVFANIPFHLSSPIVQKLTSPGASASAIFLIVQKQFAEKLLPERSGFTSQLGAQLAPFYSAKIRKNLSRTDFTPPPNVDTVLLELTPRPHPFIALDKRSTYDSFVAKCFTKPRFFATLSLEIIGARAGAKPSQLVMAQWIILFTSIQSI